MGFLRRLFGNKQESAAGSSSDPDGIYFYVECNRCHTCVRVRADRRHDLNDADGGYVWHKTIVDSRCFQRMQAMVSLDRGYNILSAEIEGGRFIMEVDYNTFLEMRARPAQDAPINATEPDAGGPQTED